MANYQGRAVYRVRDQWWFYDRLTPELRLALADSAFCWDAKWVYDRMRKGWPAQNIINALKDADAYKAKKVLKVRTAVKGQRGIQTVEVKQPTAEHGVAPLRSMEFLYC